jgi:hypothetical protein
MDAKERHSHPRSPLPISWLETKEGRAPIVTLSSSKCKALIACLEGGMLHRHCGAWIASTSRSGEKRISGITVADLAGDGMLTIDKFGKSASARLTVRGSWFARTAAEELRIRGVMPPDGQSV